MKRLYKQNFDGTVYCRILEEMRSQMEKLLPRGFYYFHDKHPVHDSIVVEECAKRNNIMLNRLPSKSSDLNPIENLWGWLKGQVSRDSPTNEAALVRSLKKNWKKVDREFLSPYINSLYNRCQECIKNKGDYINY